MIRRLIERHGMLLLAVLALFVLFAPLIVRLAAGNPITSGDESYLHLRRAELFSQGVFGYDPIREEYSIPNPYTFLLSMMLFFGVPWLLPGLLALLFLFLLSRYLSFVHSETARLLALLFVILTPLFSAMGTQHSADLLGILLILIALLKPKNPIVVFLSMALALVTTPVLGLLTCAYLALRARQKPALAVALLSSLVAAALWFILWSRALPEVALLSFSVVPNLFFELGGTGGLSIFILVIAGYGIFSRAIAPKALWPIILVLAVSVFVPALIPVAAIVLAIAAGVGVNSLIGEKWKLDLLKQSFLVLLMCVGLFLLIVGMRERIGEQPDAELKHILLGIESQHREGAVLAGPLLAPMIEYYTGHRATFNRGTSSADVERIFFTRDAETLYGFLEASGTRFVLLSEDSTRRWFSRSDEGMLFIIQNSGRFVTLQQTEHVTLWYYIPRV